MFKTYSNNIKQNQISKGKRMNPNTKTNLFFALLFSVELIFPNILLVYAREIGHIAEFTYKSETGKGPEEWSKLNPKWEVCSTGKLQSPIDLSDGRVSHIHDQALVKYYQPALASVQNRGHDVMVSWKGDAGKITINQTDYKLTQCHWHSPSEHTIDGTRYDLELHMVHTSAEDKIAVVGVLYKLGEPDQFLTKILNGIKALGQKEVDLGMVDPLEIKVETKNFYRYIGSLTAPPCTEGVIWTVDKKILNGIKALGQKEVDLGMVDPLEIKVETKNFYRYIGSLTAPPCTEGVIWTVDKKVNTISNEQITALKEAVDDGFEINSRPVQDPHGRPVWLQA